jgi:hypothetical protein
MRTAVGMTARVTNEASGWVAMFFFIDRILAMRTVSISDSERPSPCASLSPKG